MADLVVPQLGESISEAVVGKWLKNVGDAVAVDEPVAELETDKVTVQLPSPVAGALSEQRAQTGATVKVGDIIGSVKAGETGKVAAVTSVPAASATPPPTPPAAQVPKQPAVVAPPHVLPTTTQVAKPGVVHAAAPVQTNGESALDRDALMRLTPAQRANARETGALPRPSAPSAPNGPSELERLQHVDPRDEVVQMSPLRKRVAERLVQAQ